ncbi:hypothetical protein ACWEV3_41010 [Saccharopolyspora sp. NPDC003752]
MQFPDDAELAAAILANHRSFEHELLIDWDRDGQFAHPYSDLSALVSPSSVERSLTGALPPSTTIVEGTAASELKLTLVGRREPGEPTANVIFSRYAPESPLYGRTIRNTPVRYSIVVHTPSGPRSLRQFTGRIRISSTSAEHEEVSVICDEVNDLLRPVWLPAFGDVRGTDTGQMFSAHWVMDRVLRANGYYQTPAAHPGACYSATLHGSTCPEVGLASSSTLYNPSGQWRWTGGGTEPMYFDPQGQEFSTSGNTAGNRIPRPNVGNTVGLGFRFKRAGSGEVLLIQWLNGKPLGIDIPSGYETAQNCALSLRLNSSGRLVLQLQNFYGTNSYDKTVTHPTTIADTGWHTVQGECSFTSTGVTFRLQLDGGQWETTTLAGAYPAYTAAAPFPPYPYIEWPVWVQCQAFAPVTNIQTYSTTTPMITAFPADFAPSARLDQSHNRLTAVPEFIERPSWDILKELANTEFGSLYVDEFGVVQFRNMASAREAKAVADREFDASQFGGLTITDSTDNVANVIRGKIKPYTVGPKTVFDASKDTTVWDKRTGDPVQTTYAALDDLTAQPKNGIPSITIWPEVRSMLWPTTIGRNTIPFITSATWGDGKDDIVHGVCAVHAANGTEPGSKPTVDVWIDSQNTLYLAIFNQNNAYAVQISNGVIDAAHPPGSQRDGRSLQYTLRIAGVVLLEQPEIEYKVRDAESIALNGYQPYDMPMNSWTQSHAAMTYIAGELLADMARNPIPLVEDITVPGDPRVQLGDCIEITDAGPLGGSLTAVITGIRRSLSSDGLTDTYTLKLINRPAEWILGDPVYGVLGTSTILA